MAERALVAIPTYNEQVNLPLIVPQILQQDPRLEVLPAPGARGDRPGPRPLERLLLPDRDELPGLEEGIPAGGDPDRLHRPRGGPEQDEQAHRARGDLDGLVASPPGARGAPVRG